MDHEFLTRVELAALLQVTPRTLYNYIRSGRVPAPVQVGRRLLWSRASLVAAILAQAPEEAAS